MTRKAAAARLCVSLRTIDDLIATGQLAVVRFGKRCVRLRVETIDALVKDKETRSNSYKP